MERYWRSFLLHYIKSYAGPGLGMQIITILLILSHKGLVNWTVINLFRRERVKKKKFKPFVVSVRQNQSQSYVMTDGQ
jgi:hypothetical protein